MLEVATAPLPTPTAPPSKCYAKKETCNGAPHWHQQTDVRSHNIYEGSWNEIQEIFLKTHQQYNTAILAPDMTL